MWQRTAWIVVLGLPMSWQSMARSEETQDRPLIAQLRWVRFEVAGGRIRAQQVRVGQHRHQISKEHDDGTTESLAVAIDAGRVSLRYTRETPTEHLSILAGRSDRVEIGWRHQTAGGEKVEVEFIQWPRGAIQLSVRHVGQPAVTCSANGIWRLLLTEPALCRAHLVPVLELLCADCPFERQMEQLTKELIAVAAKIPSIDPQRVRQLVKQLGARQYARRQHAYRQLAALGPGVLNYICLADQTWLDREQRLRIARLQERLSCHTVDSPARVAQRLATDASVWGALMAQLDGPQRAVAATWAEGLSAAASGRHESSAGLEMAHVPDAAVRR